MSRAGWSVCFYVDAPLSHLIQELKYKVKVLLRSQSKFIPPLLVYGRLADGDTKGRSISIADGAAGRRKSVELALICVINQLIATGELGANVSQCKHKKHVC